ncbi:Rrf2 family transcriptional regulator [Xanthobacter sp. DSM 14520]|jgi:Rrf2 family nitric oxide-sensitive transcriptional repressor|uniref:RrF2 family transcriptional regulator n=1 Tax=Xanthobacter autotrophicus (strain ATCC BAA-1158 / Py2) TaxID=78245 RepID=UPI00372BEA0D
MRLTLYSDYAMRVLLHLAAYPDRSCSIADIAQRYAISHNHLMKVLAALAKAGYVTSARGRQGGYRLARDPSLINVGAVVRHTESGTKVVDCRNCVLCGACGLSSALNEAMSAFFAVLDQYSLSDVANRSGALSRLIAPLEPGGSPTSGE